MLLISQVQCFGGLAYQHTSKIIPGRLQEVVGWFMI